MNHLIVFLREPVLGKVKTRLASQIGAAKALEIYRDLLFTTLSATMQCATFSKIHLYFSEEPSTSFLKVLTQRFGKNIFSVHSQRGDTLGERMTSALQEILMSPSEKGILIGTDTPFLTKEILLEAFDSISVNTVLFGPSLDGGYYLVGCCFPFHDKLFMGVPWSSTDTLRENISVAINLGLETKKLIGMYDIDTRADFERYKRDKRLYSNKTTGPQ